MAAHAKVVALPVVDLTADIELLSTADVVQRAWREKRIKYKSRRTSWRSGPKKTLLTQPICAVDGEGKSRDDGSHHYTLLAADWGEGRARIEGESLTSEQCLDFLLSLPAKHTYVIYGGNYDCNMILRWLPRAAIDHLLDTGTVIWGKYRLKWIERKFLTISARGRSVTLYDTIAFWQKTFVEACSAWKIGTPEELEIVARMKEQRGNFNDVDDNAIENYCYLECDLLRRLCRALFDAILATPYRPSAVYGPGALANAALAHHHVNDYKNELPPEIEDVAQRAYFGGRFDCSMFGWFQDVFQYDIKSAYPDQIRYLPCLLHAEWLPVFRPNPKPYGLYEVEWHLSEDIRWPPFPYRDAKGNIWYHHQGKGWYHGDEVQAALALYGPDCINVVQGYDLVRHCDHQPFAFADELFAIRKSLPYDQGIVFKLILNSLYGKLAQQVGSERGKPKFQCFYWAGATTAGTRAKILRGLSQDPERVIGIATDSLVSLRELDLPLGDELGEWDFKVLSEYAQISNGIYHAIERDSGKKVERSRGFGRSTLKWEDVKKDWVDSRGLGTHSYQAKSRFITMREARNTVERAAIQCRWVAQSRTLSFMPNRRFPGAYDPNGPTRILETYEPFDGTTSHPFKIKTNSQEVLSAREHFNAVGWIDG